MIDFNSLIGRIAAVTAAAAMVLTVSGCGSTPNANLTPEQQAATPDYEYLIGPGDTMEVFVWGNPDLSTNVTVKPDGKITTRLVENIEASGKTASQLARDIEKAYGQYVKSAVVSVIVNNFVGVPYQQVRVVGQAQKPLKVPYRKHMTVLDAMIEVGGLTDFASGNRASILRVVEGKPQQFTVRLEDLVKGGDISANVEMRPGDVLVIPESWF